MTEFERDWARFHGNVPPLAFMMREAGRKPWIRFHALPGSVRYAQTDLERYEVLRRAKILANETLGQHQECWLVQCQIEGHEKVGWKPRETVLDFALRYSSDEEGEEQVNWMVKATLVVWHEENFDDLLADIAEDETGPTLWCNKENGSVFAPYDGGIDLFPEDIKDVVMLRARHEDWLSGEDSGL